MIKLLAACDFPKRSKVKVKKLDDDLVPAMKMLSDMDTAVGILNTHSVTGGHSVLCPPHGFRWQDPCPVRGWQPPGGWAQVSGGDLPSSQSCLLNSVNTAWASLTTNTR